MDQAQTFDKVAELYGEARPGYPAALFDDLWRLAGLRPEAAVLEVGCGAGQATADLSARAGRVVAVDLGPALIEEARRMGKRVMVGAIDASNYASLALHETMGFEQTGRMPGVGEKFGKPPELDLVQLTL